MKLYVGNLDERIEDNHLKDAFSEYGTVASAKVILDSYTNKSRGFGFIEMPNDEEAMEVIKKVNAALWEGKKLIVRKAFKKL